MFQSCVRETTTPPLETPALCHGHLGCLVQKSWKVDVVLSEYVENRAQSVHIVLKMVLWSVLQHVKHRFFEMSLPVWKWCIWMYGCAK